MCIMYFDEENQSIADLITCRTLKSNYRSPSSEPKARKLILTHKYSCTETHFTEVSSEFGGAIVVSALCSIYFVDTTLLEYKRNFRAHQLEIFNVFSESKNFWPEAVLISEITYIFNN